MNRFVFSRATPALLLALTVACGKKAAPPPPTIPVNVVDVRRTDIPMLIRATGTVRTGADRCRPVADQRTAAARSLQGR